MATMVSPVENTAVVRVQRPAPSAGRKNSSVSASTIIGPRNRGALGSWPALPAAALFTRRSRPFVESSALPARQVLLARGDDDGLRKRVADAFGRRAWNIGDRQVYDAALVGIERPQLLIEAGLFRLLGKQLGHLPQLHVLAFAILQRIDEEALLIGERPPVRHVDDVLQRFQWLTAVTHENLRLVAANVDARAVGPLFNSRCRGHTQCAREPLQKLDHVLR